MRTIQVDKYYTSMKHVEDVYKQISRKMALNSDSITKYNEWAGKVKDKLFEITGLNKMKKSELVPELLETIQLDGYSRSKMIIQTEPNVFMPFYILIPHSVKSVEKRPCIIAPHGHGSCGKFSVAGRTDIPAVADAISHYNYDYGVKLVQEGYIVFCPDARGFGERREFMTQGEEEGKFMSSSCIPLNHQAIYMGMSLTGMWTWDLMRLIDYIETREDCDSKRIGCCGLSGGGLQTLWLSAMDERVACAAVSGYFYGYLDSLVKLPNNCGCNYVPHLTEYVDMGDLGALIAPRPLLIESGSRDSLNGERGIINVTEQVEVTGKAYTLLDAKEKLYHHIFDGEHLWNGEKTYPFLDKWLKNSTNI